MAGTEARDSARRQEDLRDCRVRRTATQLPLAPPVPGRAAMSTVDLYWLPLGAGGARCVGVSGRLFEAVLAWRGRRAASRLYHSALQVHCDGGRYVIEMQPAWGTSEPQRGVVCGGPVGLPALRHSRWFRYEVRCWLGGRIRDIAEAVASPQRLSTDAAAARRLLELVPEFPTATWGLDELGAGEMWNSNSLISWLLVRSGHDVTSVQLPAGGRAPGWSAGLIVAARAHTIAQGHTPVGPGNRGVR
jgi:hypothetical protein